MTTFALFNFHSWAKQQDRDSFDKPGFMEKTRKFMKIDVSQR